MILSIKHLKEKKEMGIKKKGKERRKEKKEKRREKVKERKQQHSFIEGRNLEN